LELPERVEGGRKFGARGAAAEAEAEGGWAEVAATLELPERVEGGGILGARGAAVEGMGAREVSAISDAKGDLPFGRLYMGKLSNFAHFLRPLVIHASLQT
jgi:hypothetical protein